MQRLTFYMYVNQDSGIPYLYQQTGNPYNVEIDEQTVIAINFQAYDLKKPAERLRNVTNNFSIPSTIKNLEFFGFTNHKNILINQAPDRSIYNSILATYYLNNAIIFYKSSIRIDEISSNRIYITVLENNQIQRGIDLLKLIYWDKDATNDNSLAALYFRFINAYFGLTMPTIDAPFVGTWAQFYAAYIDNNSYIKVGDFVSNFYDLKGDSLYEDFGQYCFYNDSDSNLENKGYGARFGINVSYIFSAINWYYGTYLGTNEVLFDVTNYIGNPLDSGGGSFDNAFVFCPAILIYNSGNNWAFTFRSNLESDGYHFAGKQDAFDKPEKTMYDFLIACCQKFNWILKEQFNSDNESVIKLYNFNDINNHNNTNVVDWSNNFKQVTKFKPSLSNLYRDNYICYKYIYEGGSYKNGAKLMYCKNENLEFEGKWLEVNAYYPPALIVDDPPFEAAKLNENKAFEEFVFLTGSGKANYQVTMNHGVNSLLAYPYTLNRLANSSLDYSNTELMLNYPRVFEIERWITLEEIRNLNFFNQYYFNQLGASFYINKITGYNPMKSFEPTTLELIEVSKKIPFNAIVPNAWVDGIDEIFADGNGEYFVY